MYTSLDSHLPAVAKTGIARVFCAARGRIGADAALARRMVPC